MGQNSMPTWDLYVEPSVWQRVYNGTFDLDHIFFRQRNYLLGYACSLLRGAVKMIGSSFVIRIVFS